MVMKGMDPSIRWKLTEQKRKSSKTCELKCARDQPKKKRGRMTMFSVSSGSTAKRAVDFKARSSQGSSLISTTTGRIQKINNDRKNTYSNSSSSSGDLSGDLVVCSYNNKILNTDTEVVKKALSAAMRTSRYAEIISKRKADKANPQKEREREQFLKRKEDEARKAADLREKQREAARVALDMVEKTVEFEDNLMIVKELETLSQCSFCYIHRGGYNGPPVMGLASGGKVFNPLEKLGLYMKEEEFMTADEEEAFINTHDTEVVKKALSAAMRTSRYAEILSRRKADKANLQKERERQQFLKRKEDEARKAADSREKQREAARVALDMVERTVEFEDNLMIVKELETLSQCSFCYIHRGGYNGPPVMGLASGGKVFNPLEKLGLYMKEEEFMTADEEEAFINREVEEGEIVEF